jgi:hypothetical protein
MLSPGPTTITYIADGVSTSFTWPYYVIDPLGKVNPTGDLVVTGYNPQTAAIPTSYKLNQDYSFLGTPDSKLNVYAAGGTVVFGSAPQPPLIIRISRYTQLSQPSVWQPNDPLPAGTLEEALDRLMVAMQDRIEAIGCVGIADGPPVNDGRTYPDKCWLKNANMNPGDSMGWMYLAATGQWYLMPSISN